MRSRPVDDQEFPDLTSVGEEIDQDAVKGQRRQVERSESRDRDLADKLGIWVELWIGVVKSVHVLDQGMCGAAVAFG
jgi:hypothetical protein